MILNEADASANICYMGMSELKKEFATTETYIVEDVNEMDQVDHPTLKLYHQARCYIEKWAHHNSRWSPVKTWKGRLSGLYPRQFKALYRKGLEHKPCVSCEVLQKQLSKANVMSCFFFSESFGYDLNQPAALDVGVYDDRLSW